MKRILYTLLSLLAFVSVGAQSQTFVNITVNDSLKVKGTALVYNTPRNLDLGDSIITKDDTTKQLRAWLPSGRVVLKNDSNTVNSLKITSTPVLPVGASGVSFLMTDPTTQVQSLPFQEGVYLPDDSLSTNLTDLTIDSAFYTRVGNIVTVSGTFTASPTTGSGNTFFYMSLPISMQSLGDTYFVGGTFNAYSAQRGGAIIYGSQNRAVFQYQAGGTTTLVFSYTFSYRLR